MQKQFKSFVIVLFALTTVLFYTNSSAQSLLPKSYSKKFPKYAYSKRFPETLKQLPSGPSAKVPPIPEYLGYLIDTTFGGKITRVSNVNGRRTGTGHMAHWSCKNTYVALHMERRILDGKTYKDLGDYRVMPADGVTPWSNVDDDLMYGASHNKNVIRTYRPSNNKTGILRQFPNYKFINFSTTGNLSNDDRTMLVVGKKSDESWWYILFNPRKNKIIKEKKIVHPKTGSNSKPKHFSCSKSGKYLMVGWGRGVPRADFGNWVMDRNLNYVGEELPTTHFDHGIEYGTGKEIAVYSGHNSYYMILPKGPKVPILPYGKSAMEHVSCQGPDGWAYFSNGEYAPKTHGSDLICRVRLDGSGVGQVWAYAFAVCNPETHNGYLTCPYPAPSRDGSKVLFSSKWGAPESPVKAVFAYIAEMPTANEKKRK
jgi:hypothetical protein